MSRRLALFILLSALLGGCFAATKQAKDVQPSGFLADYRTLLKPGEKGEEALLVYRNPTIKWAAYQKILLEPVMIWHDAGHRFSPEQEEDLQHLADSFHQMLYTKLSQDYEMVEKPSPDAMRVQVAITRGQESRPGAALVSKIVPQARMAGSLWTFKKGKPAFAGAVAVEWIVKDAQTGDLLSAGADQRIGGKRLLDKETLDSWGDVKNSLEFWSDAAVYRLCVLRGAPDCVKPKP
jgi:hypothetical protein